MIRSLPFLSALLLVPAAALHAADAAKSFSEIAVPATRPAGFPRPSAVCFSSRWKHPSNPQDPHDTFQAAAAFHATGFYWITGPNQEWFREIKRRGYTVQGWLSTILPDTLFGTTRQRGRIMNEKGELVTGPWMLAWKGWWGCLNSPEYRGVYLDYVKMYLDAGVDSLHMDDPGENYTAIRWGGCYCPYCQAKAARAGKSPPDIQKESTEEFYRYLRAEMDAHAKRHVPFSCNSHPGDRCFFDEAFDFGLEELDRTTPYGFYTAVRDAERRGKAQMFTFRSTSVAETRRTIALAYNASRIGVGAAPNTASLLSFTHDGASTIAAYLNGMRSATRSGADFAAVGRFGGGHLAIPFWCGNEYHGGAVAEAIAFGRHLNDGERAGIEQYLAEKYHLRTVKLWK